MKPALIKTIALLISFLTANAQRDLNFPKQQIKVNPDPAKTWIFIMAGQSNMAGRGTVSPADTLPNPRIISLDKQKNWVLAKEPLHFYEPSRTGLDCGMSFAQELLKYIPSDVTVALIPVAVGGSSISQWLGDSTYRQVKLMSNFNERLNFSRNYGQIKGVIWHQGESDANHADLAHYEKRLGQLIKTFRKAAGLKKLPIVLGTLGSFSETKSYWQGINREIRKHANPKNKVGIISTADLKDGGDKIHFDANGQREMGRRYAIEMVKFLN